MSEPSSLTYLISQQYPGKRAFVTGAASGLGRAFCAELAKDGWLLGLADIDEKRLIESSHEFEALGGRTIPFILDVSDRENYQSVANEFLIKAGGIDLLFNNAGVGDGGNFEEYSLDNWEWIVKINQLSVVYGCHFFIPVFKKQRSGIILNTASLAAISCAPQMGAYNMTKAAVIAISETLCSELMDFNIKVACAIPSYFKTNITQSIRGGEMIRKATQYFINRSGLEAPEVAKEILNRAARGDFYIILPKAARKLWRLKRLAPTWFRKKVKEKYQASSRRVK